MRAEDIMAHPVVTVREDESLEAAARRMLEHHIGCLVVVDPGGRAVGVLAEADFMAHEAGIPFSTYELPKLFGKWVGASGLEAIYAHARKVPVREVAKPLVAFVGPGDPVEKAVDLMLRHRVKHVPVLRDGRPVGMVAHHDLLRHLARR